MAKTITLHDNGDVTISAPLTEEEKIVVGALLYDAEVIDNTGQIVFYTGIIDPTFVDCGDIKDNTDEHIPHGGSSWEDGEDFCRGT